MAIYIISVLIFAFVYFLVFVVRENWEDWLKDWRDKHGSDRK